MRVPVCVESLACDEEAAVPANGEGVLAWFEAFGYEDGGGDGRAVDAFVDGVRDGEGGELGRRCAVGHGSCRGARTSRRNTSRGIGDLNGWLTAGIACDTSRARIGCTMRKGAQNPSLIPLRSPPCSSPALKRFAANSVPSQLYSSGSGMCC